MDLRSLMFSIDFNMDDAPIKKVDSAVDDMKDSLGGSADSANNMGNEMKKSIGSSALAVKKADKATVALKETLKETGKDLQKLGKSMESAGKSMSTKVTAPIMAFGTASIMTVAKFDDSMSAVKAISGATGSEFDKLRDKAKELGATTAHSASAAADGMNILATAGWDANQILEGTPHLLSLASASGLELAQAGDIIINTLGQFSLKAKDAGMVSDILAKAASSSQTNVEQMAGAMKYAGGSAATMNMDVAQTSAILGTFANQSLKGSAAGTAFTSMFNDIAKAGEKGAMAIGESKIAVYDTNGAMRGMGSIIADIEKATNGMTDAQKNQALQSIFGVQSMRGVNAILTEGTDNYRKLEGAIRDSEGADAKMADEMENNIGGAFRGLGSAVEGLMIDLADVFKEDVKKIAKGVGELASKFGKLDKDTQRTIVKVLGVAAATGPVVFGIGKVSSTVGKATTAFGKFSDSINNVGLIKTMFSPGMKVVLVLGALVAVGYLVYKNWDKIKEVVEIVGDKFNKVKDKVIGLKDSFIEFKDNAIEKVKEKFNEFKDIIEENETAIKGTAIALGVVFGPALLITGTKAAIAGTQLAVSFIANLIKTGAQAIVSGAQLAASFTATLIRAGIQAVVSGVQITVSFVASLISTAAQAVVTGSTITGSLIGSLISYAAQGWATVSSIVATTGAWIAQRVVMAASAIATNVMTGAQWALNAAMSANPIGIVIALVAGLVVGLIALYQNSETARSIMNNAWESIKGVATKAIDGIVSAWNKLKNLLSKPITGIVNIFRKDKGESKVDGSHKTGLATVPYNGYEDSLAA